MVGMKHFLPAGASHLRQRSAGVIKPSLVVPEDPAFLVGHPGQLGNIIRQGTEALFTFTERLLSQFSRGVLALNAPTRSSSDEYAQDSSEDQTHSGLVQAPLGSCVSGCQQAQLLLPHFPNRHFRLIHTALALAFVNGVRCRLQTLLLPE